MKTLKKTLCLVLAVVMVVGVLVLPANAAATTTEDTDATAAFKTLNEYGVMYGVDANNTPALDKNINRQDMAAIVYRIMTGDTTDKYVANYVGSAAKFADSATFATWAKGYIGYVRNQGIFVGDEKGNFKPTDNITGDEVLTVLLRCIGYGQNNEFTGAAWAENAETQATQIHLFGNATGYKDVKNDMSKVINRGTVAKLTFNAVKAPMVTYYNGTYSDSTVDGRPVAPNVAGTLNPSLISVPAPVKGAITYSEWGEPSQTTTSSISFNYPKTKVEKKTEAPLTTKIDPFYVAMTQCDFAKALSLTKTTNFIVYTNGYENKTTTSVDPLNTTAQIGAQGRYTAVYANPDTTTSTTYPYILVYKDTLLAKVASVTKHTDDANGHLATKATLKLYVYAAAGGAHTEVTLTSSTDYKWTKGQYLLVNYHQNNNVATDGSILANDPAVRTKTVWEAYNKITDYKDKQDWNKDGTVDINDFVLVLQEADSFVGAQTLTSSNKTTRTIEGTVYSVNNRYHLDGAEGKMKVNFTWYKDTKGNVIGSTVIAAATSYGVINKIYWTGSNGDGAVYAEVTYADGTTDKLVVNMMAVDAATEATAVTTENASTGAQFGLATNAYTTAAMTFSGNAFYVNADAAVNKANDTVHGILNEHLFRIVASATAPGAYDFIEVGGDGSNGEISKTISGKDYKVNFTNLGNDTTDIVSGRPQNGDVLVDAETLFLVRSGSASNYTFTPYIGYTAIGDYVSGEVDYANTDDDDAADVVYIKAGAKGEQGWHLFFNTSVATGDAEGSTKKVHVDFDGNAYTVYGILDGVDGKIKVKKDQIGESDGASRKLCEYIADADNGNQLWIVYIKDGYVTDINGGVANNGSLASVSEPTNTVFADGEVVLKSANAMGTVDDDLGDYKDLKLIKKTVNTDTEVVAGNITIGGVSYAVSGNTPAIGTWASLATAGTAKVTYTVIMVYDKNNKVVQAYITSEADGTEYNPGTPTPPATPAVTEVRIDESAKTVVVYWHQVESEYDAPTQAEAQALILAKLAADGWTDIEVGGTSAAPTFKCTKTVNGVKTSTTYTWTVASGIVASIRVYVGDGTTPMLIAPSTQLSALVNAIDVNGYPNTNENVYIKTKLSGGTADEDMKALNATDSLVEGDIVYTNKQYIQLTSATPTVTKSAINTSTPFGSAVSAETEITAEGIQFNTATPVTTVSGTSYLEIGKSYTVDFKLKRDSGAVSVQTGYKVTAAVTFGGASNLETVKTVDLLKAGSMITKDGNTYHVSFKVVVTDKTDGPGAAISGITITLTGAAA